MWLSIHVSITEHYSKAWLRHNAYTTARKMCGVDDEKELNDH